MRPSGGTGQATKPPRQKRGPSKSHRAATAVARGRRPSVAKLEDELTALKRELTKALDRQTATAEVLNVISRSTFQLQPVLDTIVQTASRLCNAETALIFMFRDEKLHLAATNNASSAFVQHALEYPLPVGRGSITGRTFLERRTVHLPDCLADPEYTLSDFQAIGQHRSMLGVPLLREGSPIGVITLWRTIVLPFTDTENELVKTFADQAVIAIENARLFDAEQQRARELSEALERQTATAEVLNVISRSTAQLQPVLDTIVKTASRLCNAEIALIFMLRENKLCVVATNNASNAFVQHATDHPLPLRRGSCSGRSVLERQVIHIPDCLADPEYTVLDYQAVGKYRSMLGVPLLSDGAPIGVITLVRTAVMPFTEKQIDLVKLFADQAVIAIENTRLLNELRESLQQQTATADVLKIISQSTFQLQPVFDAIAQTASRLCNAEFAMFSMFREGKLHLVASNNASDAFVKFNTEHPIPPGRGSLVGRTFVERNTVHIPDCLADPEYTVLDYQAVGRYRSMLGVPLLREGTPIGVIGLLRTVVMPFTERQIDLVKTFADQAVIAIENVRLFDEVQARTDELSEALRQQTATAEVLQVISRSAFDLQPVFDTVAESSVRLCDAERSTIFRFDGELLRIVAAFNSPPDLEEWIARHPIRPGRTSGAARAALERRTIHIPDVLADPEYTFGAKDIEPVRTVLAVPILKGDDLLGVIIIYRFEVRPFTDKQIALVETFADQAAIAIENVRLFDEVKARTDELSESLQQQTATAEVLKAISQSTFDLQTVLDTLVESAARLCSADHVWLFQHEGDLFRWVAGYGHAPDVHAQIKEYFQTPLPVHEGSITGRTLLEARVIHLPDVLAEYTWNVALQVQKLGNYRAALGVPLLRNGNAIGVIFLGKRIPGPFTPKQIELATTFADQAVIAIENTRLLNELRESLRQQTATADVLKVISRSAFDLPTVLETLVESASKLCESDKTTIIRQKGDSFYITEAYGFSSEFIEAVKNLPIEPTLRTASGRALLEGHIVHIFDVEADPEYTFTAKSLGDYRTILALPMLRESEAIGVLVLTRSDVRPFTDKQIETAQTFADQAAIAIENVRLFDSVEARTRELAKSLGELRTAQDRLVQTEKLASLGQLTAGIAHEIKNPLNFVNNFSSLGVELIGELEEALQAPRFDDKVKAQITELADMLKGNLDKVVEHGKRADSIVKNMLLHSRQESGEHRPVGVNALVAESLNLAYHGARAAKQSFNITLEQSFDPAAGKVDVFPQEIIRVLLNLISNGFYAATKRKAEANSGDYEPTLTAMTKDLGDSVEIRIRDNGTGIPPEVREKIFNPFFTTKPAGEGTGLGLSLSYDIIVKQHGGSIEVDTQPGEFTEFRIVLPRSAASAPQPGERQ
jgi:GAF domain-containing protein